MCFSQKALYLTGLVFTIFFSYVITFPEDNEDKTLKLKIGFDLTQGTNGAPSLQIRNFEEGSKSRKLNGHKEKLKRSATAQSTSESYEMDDNEETLDTKVIQETDLSDDAEHSGSEDDRRLSTKGLNPEDFEPENKANIHEKYKEEDSEAAAAKKNNLI